MAIHCMLLTGDNIRIVQNFLSEFKDKYDCMQTFDMVRSMISAWQSANFKDGEEPIMPTKDEIEQFIQSQLGKDKSKTNATSRVTKIISGGQTGVDTIGLQVAKKLGIETGGTAPKGFLREKGIDTEDISSYGLTEISDTEQADYTKRKGKSDPYTGRTELNVRNSDGTVYFSTNADSAGRIATERSAREWNKPFLLNPTAEQLREWINTHNIKILNIAGNRGSKLPANNRIADIITEALSPIKSTNIADYVNTEGEDKGFLTKKGEELLSTTFDKSKFNKGTFSVALYPGPTGTTLMIGFISPRTGNKAYVQYNSSPTRKTLDLLDSDKQTVTNVNDKNYWKSIDIIVPKPLRDLVDSGEYYKMDTTDTEKGGEASLIKRSELEEYFEKEYNVFMQGRSLDYNTKQINKALSPVQETTEKQDNIPLSYEGYITPSQDTIFVFGSNPEGRHGTGAAKTAREKFGAIYGQGEGLQGNAYALPTKDLRVKENKGLKSISAEQITENIKKMYNVAKQNPSKKFKIAYTNGLNETTLNGYTGAEMIKMFKDAGPIPSNVIFSKNWTDHWNEVNSTKEQLKEAPIQEDDKSYAEDLARCARQMSPIERKHRVERITRMFSSIVNSKLKDKLATYNDKIQAETNPKVKNDLLFGRKKITRFSVIKSEGVQSIMMEVRKAFQIYTDAPLEAKIAIEKQQILSAKPNLDDRIATNIARSVAERKTKAFQNVLNNFQVLAEEALGNLALTEGISVNLNSNFVLNTQENSDTFNEDGKQTNQGDVFKKEESLKDGWMTDVRQVATFDSLTARVRQAIGNMVRYDSTGNVDRDDLGDNIYLNAGYVHSELIQALRNMVSAEDMIPMLKQLSKKKVWVKQIINELNNDNQLFTEFYRAYRKDYVNYFIQKVSTNSDTSTSTKVMSINGAEGTSHYFDEWRDNYEYGNVLTTDSIYDKNGDIQLKNAKVGLDLVDSLLDIFEDRETIAENLTDENIARIKKVMNMLGASVDSETLENALKFNLDNKAFKPAVNVLLSNLRTIYYDLNKGNEKVKDGEYVDLLNIHGTAFNNIAEIINKVDEDTIESSVRQGDKTMYAHINPSYVTTLIKKLQREDTYKQVLDDYRVCSWFNKNGKWRNSILEEIENSAEVRSNLKHVVLLQYNRKEYAAWTDLDATLALYNMYMTGAADRSGSETYGYYQVPMLSDAQSAEFIKFKRYKKEYEEKLLDKFKDLVYQEIDRINLVKERATTDNHIDPIANFDMNGKKMGGAEFKFFPELNQKDESGKTFLQAIDEAKQISMDEVDNLIKNTIKDIMDSRFKESVQHYKDIGLYDRIGTEKNARFKYVNVYSEEGMNDRMREWFWNSTYFTSQFIELTTTDLAYYKNLEDFQKRNKQDHAPAERLNTLATWNGKPVLVNNDGSRRTVRRVIYLKDNILPANSMDSINEILEARVKDKDDAFTAYDKAAIMSIFNKVNVADAQAYNTLPSFRSTQIMAGMWSDAEETAYNNIMNNKWTASDFLVLWNTRKPYLYTQKNQPDGMGGIMKVPTQHKNSEFLLLTGAMFGQILHSSKLQALNDFMVKNNIDSAMFESAVKDGLQGTINLNDATNYVSTMAVLENATRLNGKENPNVVHEFDYNDYGIQTSTPEHGIDKVQLVGTQIRKLISSDMNPNRDPNFKLKYKDREFTQEEWMNHFNAINTANIQEAFKEVSDKFNDIHEVEKELIREVRSNPRYGTDLIRALTLDENGNFNIPLIDPSQTLRIQALLNSILKNRVTKQKINGGALIQASPFGLDEDKQPQIVYNEDGSIKYFEAYLPCPTEELYNALLDPNTHELDINKKDSKGNYIVPEKYREVIGYRVPTENKYSMQHIRIKGFLPRQVGSVIILPKEITSLAGSDFDKLMSN